MPYCTLDDLKKQTREDILISLTCDPTEEVLEIKPEVVAAAIASADAEIDGYARTQYDVPFNPVPDIIRKFSVDITLYNLFSRRGVDKEKEANIVDRYKSAIRFLENLAKGLVTIGATAGSGQSAPAPPIGMEIQSDRRIFTRNSLKGM
jgi:phage gp36-like protein